MSRFVGFLFAAFFLSSCFNLPVKSSAKVSTLNTEPRSAVTRALSETKAVSAYDPNSKVETTVRPPSGALSASKVTLPAGALSIAVDLVIEESVAMSETSVVSTLNLREDIKIEPVGAGLIIRPSQNVDLTRPLTIAMSMEAITGLSSWLNRSFLAKGEHYAVFYKSMIAGQLRVGVIPSSSLRYSDDGKVIFEGYFGAFWLCKVSAPIEERVEAPTNEPTVNKSGVSVIESTGIVTEASIAAKAAIPEVVWTSVNLSFDAYQRKGALSAAIAAGRSLSSCQVDLRVSVDASSGSNSIADATLSYTFSIVNKAAHNLVGRFRCMDDQGRQTISKWSSVLQIPSEPDPAVATSIKFNPDKAFTSTTQVSLAILANGATEMYITSTAGCSAGGVWEAYNTSKAWTLTQTNTAATVYGKFRNQLGRESACISASIIHDNIPPSGLNLSINGGATYTTSTAVSLTLQATSAAQMYLSNIPGCTSGGSWSNFSSSASWTLAQSNSTATVYVKFKDLAENVSSCISSSIIHNGAPIANSLLINSGASSTTGSAVTLSLSASAASQMYITNTSTCASGGTWEAYGTSKAWTLAQSSGTALVYAKFRNTAGNESSCINASIIVNAQGPLTALQVMGGSEHTCALLAGGAVKCWGYNGHGQLGQGHTTNIGSPANIQPINLGTNRTATAIAVGQLHSCALLDNGTVKCWGYNYQGQLGQGHGNSLSLIGDNVPAIDLGSGRTARAISSLYYHTCALLDNFSVKCWGHGPWGNLGYGNANDVGNAANQMGDSLPVVNLGTGRTAKSIAAGVHHSCAVLDNNTVKCWGHNGQGQLGQGHINQIGDEAGEMGDSLPAIALGAGRTAKTVSVGYVHSCAVLDNDAVKCWGSNNYGELGQGHTNQIGDDAGEMGDSLPMISLGSGLKALALSSGFHGSCALLDNYNIKCWGYNEFGQLGLGANNSRGSGAGEMGDALPAVNLGTGKTALAIGSGWYHSCAVLNNESMKCWGYNNYGQLGLGHANNVGASPGDMGDALPAINFGSEIEIPQTGLKLWLRSDSGLFKDTGSVAAATTMNDPIAKWEDRSGNGGHMTVAGSLNQTTARPLLNTSALNGFPTVAFNGSANLLNNVSYNYPNTIFILARYTGSPQGRILAGSNTNWLLGWYDGKADSYYVDDWASYSTNPASLGWEIYAGEQTSSSQRLFHGYQQITSTYLTATSGPMGLSLGGWSYISAEYSAAEVAEVIAYDRVLTDSERSGVVNYLMQRYALSP